MLCGDEDGKITLEHIYGDWMAQEFPEQERSRKRAVLYTSRTTGEVEMRKWEEKESRHQTKVKALCEECNNVWGSRMEAAVRPVITPMIRGDDCYRNVEAVRTLATWAAKVAALQEFLDPPEMRVLRDLDRRRLRVLSEPPINTVISIGAIAGVRWGITTRRRVGGTLAPPVPADTYMMTIGFGALLLIVGGNTTGVELTNPAEVLHEALRQVWPDPKPFRWPPRIALTDEEIDHLSGQLDALVNPPWAYPPKPGPPPGFSRQPRRSKRSRRT